MVCEETLKIRNFPECLTKSEKEDFLRHFGATEVKIIEAKMKRKTVAYAKFTSKQIAHSVLHRLHQMKILDSLLFVEYAPNDLISSKPRVLKEESEDYKNRKHYKNFITRLNAFNNSVNFNQPPPHHLKYAYPKPNRATINNIAHALASVPKFYTQVLHLMNRMNLPPPFSNTPDPPPVPVQEVEESKKSVEENSSESEIESDGEVDKNKEVIPVKRSLKQKKVIKRPKFIKPNVVNPSQTVKDIPGDVFETVEIQQRKIEVKVSAECLENKTGESKHLDDSNTIVGISNSEENKIADDAGMVVEHEKCITTEELNANRIPLKDLNVLPVFKDYHPGVPSSRLYIKNIAKTVEKSDLEFIYMRYVVKKGEEAAGVFNIRLMQEGRMKGQAFVTLDSVEVAQTALKETNGFILKDKPLVVVFGRSAINKK